MLSYAIYPLFVALLAAFSYPRIRLLILSLSALLAGILRVQFFFDLPPTHTGDAREIHGVISEEPDVRQDSIRYVLRSDEGNIQLKQFLYPRYAYGDELRVKCTLKAPEVFDSGFRYDLYLANQNIFSLCENAIILSVEKQKPTIYSYLLGAKTAVAKKINLLWHEPYAGFMAGLLYGYRGGLGSLDDAFATVGLTHIVAISGYNITMVATLIMAVCIRLWIPKKISFWCIVIGISIFVLFVGASASVVRAGIMGVITLFAKHIGRRGQAGGVLLLAACLMTMKSPLSLLWDAGFQLSFLATIGLVYVSPLIEEKCKWIPEKCTLRESCTSTLAAIITTQPLVLYQFRKFSLVAPVINVLVLWCIPLIMAVGAIAVFCSFIYQPVGTIISWLAFFGMKYITVLVHFFAELPLASIMLPISVWFMILLYVLLFGFVFQQTKKR